MLKTITKDVNVCDSRGTETYPHLCLKCGADYCYDCSKTRAKEYPHAIGVSGSGDGKYCNGCDAELSAAGTDPVHNAYVRIESLRNEELSWYAEFRERRMPQRQN